MVCFSRSRLGRGGLTHLCGNFLRYRTGGTSDRKSNENRNGSGSHVASETSRQTTYGPQNLAARTLSVEEHTLSKFCRDPCPVRCGLVAAVKCYVRKTHFFFSLLGQVLEQNKRSQSLVCGFQHHKGENLLCFLFSDPVIVYLTYEFEPLSPKYDIAHTFLWAQYTLGISMGCYFLRVVEGHVLQHSSAAALPVRFFLFFLPKDSICNTLVTDLCIRTPCTSLSCLAPPQTSSATCWRSWTGTRSGRRRSPWKRGICPTRCISRVVHRLLDYLVHCFAGCDRPFICSSRPSFLVGAGSERVLGAPCRQLRIYYMYAYPGSVGGFGCGRDQVLFGLGCQVGAGCSYVSTACVGSRKQPENNQYLTN